MKESQFVCPICKKLVDADDPFEMLQHQHKSKAKNKGPTRYEQLSLVMVNNYIRYTQDKGTIPLN